MKTRIVIIAGSVVAAGLVLLAAYLANPIAPPPSGDAGSSGPRPTAGEDDQPPGVSADERFVDESGRYERREDGRRTILTWDRLEPQPKGRARVTEPSARVEFSPQRVMTIDAARGRLYAPENEPRQGHFEGRVVVTMYRTSRERAVSLTGTRDIAVRVYLKEADFDLELGRLTSVGPVHLTGPRVDFHGRGLTLNYNELHNRLQRLRVHQGQRLRLRGRALDGGEASEPATGPSTQAATATAATQPGPPGGDAAGEEPGAEGQEDGARAGEFYRARFEEDVRVEALGRGVQMRGDRLDAVFSFAGEQAMRTAERDEVGDAGRDRALPGPVGPRLAAADDGLAGALTQATRPSAGSATRSQSGLGPSLMETTSEDVVIEWSGPLVVTPEADPPRGLEQPEDMQLALRGTPVRVLGEGGARVTAARLSYLVGPGRLTAVGDASHGLEVAVPELGQLRGERAVLSPADQSGFVEGPGTLIARERAGERAREAGAATQPAGRDGDAEASGSPLEVAWQERLNLRFAGDAQAAAPDGDGTGTADTDEAGAGRRLALGRLGALESATFRGAVEAAHPRFDMAGQAMTVRFAAGEAGERRPSAIEASGDVRLATRGRGDQPPGAIRSQALDIALGRDGEGRLTPTALTARRDVTLTRPDLTLRAERLDATMSGDEAEGDRLMQRGESITLLPREPLAVPPAAELRVSPTREPAEAGPLGDVSARLESMVAERDVRVSVDDPPLELRGARLTLTPRPERMTLIGTSGEPARARQPGGELTGERIHVNRSRQTVRVPGAGRFTFEGVGDDGGEGESDGAGGGTTLATRWRDSMRYDHGTGRAALRGRVRAETRSASETTRLTSGELDLTFEPADGADGDPTATTQPTAASGDGGASADRGDSVSPETQRAETQPAMGGSRRLVELEARDSVVFTAQSRATTDTGRPHTRLRLEGPTLRFDRAREMVRVLGSGRLLIEDHRPSGETGAATQPRDGQAGGASAVSFTGRGQTLFTWDGRLKLDAAKSDMLIENNVWMIHRPDEDAAPMTLESEHLLADLSDAGGLGMWRSEDAPDPELHYVQADENVRIEHAGRSIDADHLKYRRQRQELSLWANGENYVRVQRRDQPTGFEAKRVDWSLDTDRLEATGVRGGTAPVPP